MAQGAPGRSRARFYSLESKEKARAFAIARVFPTVTSDIRPGGRAHDPEAQRGHLARSDAEARAHQMLSWEAIGRKFTADVVMTQAKFADDPSNSASANGKATNTVLAFLKALRPEGPWVLTAIDPNTPAIETITVSTADEVDAFVRKYDGKRNLYYSVNPTRTTLSKKAKKTDIAAIEYALADLDPKDGETSDAAKERYLTQLDGVFTPNPTVVVDSGNGIQCLWKLKEPIVLDKLVDGKFSSADKAKIDDVEARIESVMLRLGSKAGTQNIDRILRLPGTINLPNKKKLNAGRIACPTRLIRFNGATFSLDAFPAPEPSGEGRKAGARVGSDIDELPISKRMKDLIRGIDDPKHPYATRSEAVFAVIVAMVSGGCADGQIEAVFLDAGHPISAHVLEQAKPLEYLARQIAKARELTTAADPEVAKLNKHFALVVVGDKCTILKITDDGIKFWTLSAFYEWHANRYVHYENKKVPLAKHWMHHRQRRQYEGVVFAPGRDVPNHYNLWRGFAVERRAGDCSKFLAHLNDNVCRGDKEVYNWAVGWFANIIQHPERKMGTSLVLRGKMGTGKTKVGEVFGSLLGTHYVPVSDPRYVTGRFNSHLVSCLLLHCDEAFWAGDHAAEGKLKDLITGQDHLIEFKGKEPIKVRNYVRLLVTGNPDWLVPAGFEERRFAVLDVGESHMQDKAYFAAIDEGMDNGGREALIDHLMKFDLRGVDLRTIPKTSALLDQKISTLPPLEGWWLDTLTRGQLPGLMLGESPKGYWTCPSTSIFELYFNHAQKQGIRRRSLEVQIGIFLKKHVPGLRKRESTTKEPASNSPVESRLPADLSAGHVRSNVYDFPPLATCRKAFAESLQQGITWPENSEWAEWPTHFPTGKFV
jgi:Family of unknown function (DUF5906)